MNIQKVSTTEQIESCYPVMVQLRPHFTAKEAFIKQVQRQTKNGYHLVYAEENGKVTAVSGFRFLEFLAWGKVLYIDDLVTDSTTRKSGHASKLLQWIIELAKQEGCDQIHLDSGPQRHDAHRLYLNHKFKITGHHFSLNLKEP